MRPRFRPALLAAIAAPGLVTAADGRAQSGDIGPPVAEVCRATFGDRPDGLPILEPIRLVRWALSVAPVTDAALDTDADGTTSLAEKQLALADPDFCARPGGQCSASDRDALRDRHAQLAAWIAADGGPHYSFERLRDTTPAERYDNPILDPAYDRPGRAIQLGEILRQPADLVRVTCHPNAKPQAVASAPPSELPPPPSPELRPQSQPFLLSFLPRPRLSGFRLAATSDDLTADRGQLSAVSPAEVTINSDLRAGVESFYARAAAGYAFDLGEQDPFSLSVLPFASLERQEDNSRRNIDKVALGSSLVARRDGPDGRRDEFSLTPIYGTDTKADIQVGILRFRYTPTLAPDSILPLGQPLDLGWARVMLHGDLLSEYGRVYADGGDDSVLDEGDFLRAGTRLRGRVRGANDTLLSQFEIDGSVRALYSLHGDPDWLNLYEAGVSFVFPDQDHYRVRASYASGTDQDTLEEQRVWRVSLGVRF